MPILRIGDSDSDAARKYQAVNVMIVNPDQPDAAMPASFHRDRCFDTVCVYTRPGACEHLAQPRVPIVNFDAGVAHEDFYPRIEGVE